MSANSNLYEVLDCQLGADKQTVRRAYQRLILALHPDKYTETDDRTTGQRHAHLPSAEDVIHAWSVLGDDKKREEYDRSLLQETKVKEALSYRFAWKQQAEQIGNVQSAEGDQQKQALGRPRVHLEDETEKRNLDQMQQDFIMCPQCGELTCLEGLRGHERIECDSCSITIEITS